MILFQFNISICALNMMNFELRSRAKQRDIVLIHPNIIKVCRSNARYLYKIDITNDKQNN